MSERQPEGRGGFRTFSHPKRVYTKVRAGEQVGRQIAENQGRTGILGHSPVALGEVGSKQPNLPTLSSGSQLSLEVGIKQITCPLAQSVNTISFLVARISCSFVFILFRTPAAKTPPSRGILSESGCRRPAQTCRDLVGSQMNSDQWCSFQTQDAVLRR